MTHPALGSLVCYVNPAPTNVETLTVSTEHDADQIHAFCEDYRDVTNRMMSLGVLLPLTILRVINELGLAEFYTEAVMGIALEAQPAWAKLTARLNDKRLREELEAHRTRGAA